MSHTPQALACPSAAFVALVGGAALIGQYAVTPVGLATGRHGRDNPGAVTAGLVLSILVVAIVYHTLLSGLWSLDGLGWWADQGLHTAMPVLTTGWWLVFAPKSALTVRVLPAWLILPLAYCAYAVTRGAVTGFWAYPFLDPGIHGAGGVAFNMAAWRWPLPCLALSFWL